MICLEKAKTTVYKDTKIPNCNGNSRLSFKLCHCYVQ